MDGEGFLKIVIDLFVINSENQKKKSKLTNILRFRVRLAGFDICFEKQSDKPDILRLCDPNMILTVSDKVPCPTATEEACE